MPQAAAGTTSSTTSPLSSAVRRRLRDSTLSDTSTPRHVQAGHSRLPTTGSTSRSRAIVQSEQPSPEPLPSVHAVPEQHVPEHSTTEQPSPANNISDYVPSEHAPSEVANAGFITHNSEMQSHHQTGQMLQQGIQLAAAEHAPRGTPLVTVLVLGK